MGVAHGILYTTEADKKYQQIFINSDFEQKEKLNLYAMAQDGFKFEPVGGVAIFDYSMQLGNWFVLENISKILLSSY